MASEMKKGEHIRPIHEYRDTYTFVRLRGTTTDHRLPTAANERLLSAIASRKRPGILCSFISLFHKSAINSVQLSFLENKKI
jgi:hypothetical protein